MENRPTLKKDIRSRLLQLNRRQFRFYLFIILSIFGIFFSLMWRQAGIVRQGYINADLEIKIQQLQVEMVQKQESLYRDLDLNNLRLKAQEAGLFLPQDGQIVQVNVPKTDFVHVVSNTTNTTSLSDGEVSKAMEVVGAYLERKQQEAQVTAGNRQEERSTEARAPSSDTHETKQVQPATTPSVQPQPVQVEGE